MKKILFIISFPVVGLLLFCLGYIYHKPKTITVTKEVKVYDFSQEPRAMEIYANMMGKTLENKKEIEEYKNRAERDIELHRNIIWTDGFQEGVKAGFLQR